MDEEETEDDCPEAVPWEQVLAYLVDLRQFVSLQAERERSRARKAATQRRWRAKQKGTQVVEHLSA